MANYQIDHIDPDYPEGADRPYQMVCGFTNPFNLVYRDRSTNSSKSNRFLPWRVAKDELGTVPVNAGDLCLFLDWETEDWVLEEFLGEWWYEKTRNSCGNSVAGRNTYENKTGFWAFTEGQRTEVCKKGAANQSIEDKAEGGRRGSKTQIEQKTGIYGWTPEQKTERGKKGRSKLKPETLVAGGVAAGKVKYMCLKTGHISTAPGLAHYQRAKGIDTTYRVRLTPEETAFIFLWA